MPTGSHPSISGLLVIRSIPFLTTLKCQKIFPLPQCTFILKNGHRTFWGTFWRIFYICAYALEHFSSRKCNLSFNRWALGFKMAQIWKLGGRSWFSIAVTKFTGFQYNLSSSFLAVHLFHLQEYHGLSTISTISWISRPSCFHSSLLPIIVIYPPCHHLASVLWVVPPSLIPGSPAPLQHLLFYYSSSIEDRHHYTLQWSHCPPLLVVLLLS